MTGKKGKLEPEAAKKGFLVTQKDAREYKVYAAGFEKKNNGYILVFPCSGDLGWYEMGDVSAMIYSHLVCKPRGVKANLQDDSDSYYGEFEYGRVRTQSLKTLEKRIDESGLFKETVQKGAIIFYKMKKPLTKTELQDLIAAEKARQARANRIVEVADVDAKLDQMLLEVSARLHSACLRHMDPMSAETSGVTIVNFCREIRKKYLLMCEPRERTNREKLAEWREMREMVHMLLIEINIVIGMRVWKRAKYVTLVEKIMAAEERIDNHIATLAKKGK